MPYILIHGLGQGGDAWEPVRQCLRWEPVRQCLRAKGWAAVCPELFSHLPEGADYDRLRQDFFSFCDAQAGALHLCGLSLGGVLALDYAKAHPERMGSLVLIGTPCKLPRGLLRMQSLVFRCLPRAAFAEMGISRETACGLMTFVGERLIREGLEDPGRAGADPVQMSGPVRLQRPGEPKERGAAAPVPCRQQASDDPGSGS